MFVCVYFVDVVCGVGDECDDVVEVEVGSVLDLDVEFVVMCVVVGVVDEDVCE